ncbi:MAG: 4Fe-4S dicluster domain-containing protein [Verrucomicrobia bacterium]|nr:4Fe-4S dicluster domain-containing protein [Cytophagales bacterium]
MAIMITDDCLNCEACEPECPTAAIFEGGAAWSWAAGTKLKGEINYLSYPKSDAGQRQEPLSTDHYYVVAGKCTECIGFHEEPQCAAVCPVDCCLPDPDWVENKNHLLEKAKWLLQTDNSSAFYDSFKQKLEENRLNKPACGCGEIAVENKIKTSLLGKIKIFLKKFFG